MKRVSSIFKKDKAKTENGNGYGNGNGNGIGNGNGKDNGNGNSSGQNGSKSKSTLVPQDTITKRKSVNAIPENGAMSKSDQPNNDISHAGISETFRKYSQVLQAALKPMPTTGDGSYAEVKEKSGLWDDLKSMDIGDAKTLQMMLAQELSGSKITNDRTMLMERTIQLVAALPSNSQTRVKLTNVFVGQLWDSLQHPPNPMSRLGDLFQYRQPDGSYNNPMHPQVGQAGTTYARSVNPVEMMPGALPDPGLIFDSVLDRGGKIKEHPNGVSSMLYYIASIIIHDCFRTSHEDFNVSTTSSYLDLSPLYGSNQAEQDSVRTFKDGKLKPDCFSEKRLIGFPPGVGCILIMFNRFHNYIADQLPVINEGGRFTKPRSDDPAAWTKYENSIFQTARLITGGLYINIILGDYLRTIVGLNRVSSDWSLDPRVDMEDDEKTHIPRGCGNQTSVEFNLVYRWHSAISGRDEAWTEALYMKLFGKPASEVTMHELLAGLSRLEAAMPADPMEREIGDLVRGADGKYNDDDLVGILTDSIEDIAGASGSRNIPTVMRAVEILGMKQARAWKCASLNEFRKHFGLAPYKTFEEITEDKYVVQQLKNLYDAPEFVELYTGLIVEDAKKPMTPGVGICPTYTISRAILSDAVTLVRGDRFYTTDYNAKNLTNFGFSEVAQDLSINQGCVFYKLFLRAFPSHFKYNSIYAHYPLVIPSENNKIMKDLGRQSEFTWERPTRMAPRINVSGYDGVMSIMNDADNFKVTWGEGLGYLMGKPGMNFMLSGDGAFYNERREMMGKCLYQNNWKKKIREFYEVTTTDLLKQWGYQLAGTNMVDIVRDVGNSAHVHFASAIFELPLKTKENEDGVFTEHQLYTVLAVIFTTVFLDFDPAKTFALRKAGLEVTQALGQLVESNVTLVSRTSLISALVDPFMQESNALKDYGVHMIRQLLASGLGVHETTWSQILPTAGAMVANQAQVFGQVIDFYLSAEGAAHLPEINRLAKLNTGDADDVLLHYLLEGVRLNGTFGAYRRAAADTVVNDNGKPVRFDKGRNAFCSFLQIARDPAVYPDPHTVRLDRPVDSYIVYGIGSHACLGGEASRVALTAMLKTVGRLDNLRRAPGAQGETKKIPREGGFYAYMDAKESRYWPFPTTMKVCWDGDVVDRKKW